MFSDKGDRVVRRGSSLLRFAEEPAVRPRGQFDPRHVLDQLMPEEPLPLDAAMTHRRARAKRERTHNPLLSALGGSPEAKGAELPFQATEAPSAPQMSAPPPPMPSLLEKFDEIDRAVKARGDMKIPPAPLDAQDSGTGWESSGQDIESRAAEWRPLVDPRFIWESIVRWRGPILGCGATGAVLGVLLALSTPKYYYATASLSIDPRGLKVIENGVAPDSFLSDTFAVVDSQLQVVSSPKVMEEVVRQLPLASDPEFNGERKSGWMAALMEIIAGKDADGNKERQAAKYLSDHVFVERGAKTYVINITAASENPEKAALIANKIVDVYISEQKSQQSETVRQTTDDLTGRLAALKAEVEKSEQRVEAFKAENDLIDAGGRMIDDEAILRLNDQLQAARGQTIALNARAKLMRDVTPESLVGVGAAEEVNSPALTAMRSQYSSAKQKRDGLATKLGPRHPERILAESELSSLRSSIGAEIKRVSSTMQSDLKRAVQTEQDLASRLAEMKAGQGNSGGAQVKLAELQREAAASRSVYEAFLLRARQTGEQIGLNTSNIKLIVSARPPLEPAGSSRKLIAIGGLLTGLIFGLVLAVLKGVVDSFRAQPVQPARAAPRFPVEPAPGPGGMFRKMGLTNTALLRPADASSAEASGRTQNNFQAEAMPLYQEQPQVMHNAAAWSAHHTPAFAPETMGPAGFPPAPTPNSAQQWHFSPPAHNHQTPVPAGPMMYPPPQVAMHPAFVPQQVFAPQPVVAQNWPQGVMPPQMPQPVQMPHAAQPVQMQFPAPQPVVAQNWPQGVMPPQMPQPVQMPYAAQPVQMQFPAPQPHAPNPAALAQVQHAAMTQAPHPFANEAYGADADAAAAEMRSHVQRGASPKVRSQSAEERRISDIQESIDEFREALSELAVRRRAS